MPYKDKQKQLEYSREYSRRPESRQKQKAFRTKFPERHRIYNKTYARNMKILVITHYSSGSMDCLCCKENKMEFLSIDHINGGGNKNRKETGRSGHRFYTWLKMNGFPKGYRVLCMNCNFALGHHGYCPHNKLP